MKHSGRLDELRLPMRTYSMFDVQAMIGMIPVALRALRRGKAPSPFHKSIPGAENIRRIFNKVEREK